MSNPAPTLNQINAFNATQGTTIDFNIIGGTEVIRSNKIYIYDLSDNSLICTHLYVSTESIHELPPNTSSSIVYASGKSSADFTNNTQYYAQIQTFTDVGGTQGGSGLSIAKLFWCLPTPTLTLSTIPTTISTTSYNVSATYTPNTSGGATNEIQEFQFNLYSAIGALLQTSGVVLYGEGVDLSYNFSGLEVDSTYYVTLDVTTTQGMNVSAQSNTFTVSIDTPTMGSASVVNNGCDGYISVTSNLSSEYEHEESVEAGEIMSFTTDSVNDITELDVDFEPVQDGTPWMSAQDTAPYMFRPVPTQTEDFGHESDCIVGGTVAWNQLVKNGNFVDTSNWSSAGYGTLSASNNVCTLTITSTGTSARIQQTVGDCILGHKYFMTFEANPDKDVVMSLRMSNNSVVPQNTSVQANQWTRVDKIGNAVAIGNIAYLYVNLVSATLLVGDSVKLRNVSIIDLTQLFGTTIANYVYTLEQGTAGAGVAWLRANAPQLFEYHAYDAGSLVSVSGLTSHDMTRKNLADLSNLTTVSATIEVINGDIHYTTSGGGGANGVAFKKVLPPGTYTINYTNTNNDSEKGSNYSFCLPFIPTGATSWSGDNTFVKSLLGTNEGHYKNITSYIPYTFIAPEPFIFGLVCSRNNNVSGVLSNIQLELGSTATTYEPYTKHSYPLDSTLTLRGIPKLDASNKLYYDGDRYNADGSVDRRYGIVDLGSLTYTIVSGSFAATISDKANGIGNLICVKYPNYTTTAALADMPDKMIKGASNGSNIYIKDSAYNDKDTFKTAMDGVYLVYEKAIPTTSYADPYTNPQLVDPHGTEQYVGSPIPVGHETTYQRICPISGWDSVDVDVVGVNIFDGTLEQGTFTNQGAESAASSRIRTKYVLVDSGDVSISTPTSNVYIHEVYCYDANNAFISRLSSGIGASSGTVTVPSGAKYIRFSLRHPDNSTITPSEEIKVQVELSATPTPYTPYNGTTYTSTFPKYKQQVTQDKIPYITKNIGDTYADTLTENLVGGTIAWNQSVPDTTTTHTVSGSIASMNDAVAGNFESVVCDIDPVQDLHGYDKPWVGGSGKNKFSGETKNGYNINSTGNEEVDAARSCTTAVEISASTEYTVSYSDPESCGVFFYASDNSFISYIGWGSRPKTFTTPANAKYVRFTFRDGTAPSDVQLELGSTATTYEPYANICPITGWTGCEVDVSPTEDAQDGTTYPITWQTEAGTVYGGTVDLVTGVLTVDRVGITYNGSEAWDARNNDANEYYYIKVGDNGSVVSNAIISDRFVQADIRDSTTVSGVNLVNSSAYDGAFVYIRPENVTSYTLNTFKAWLANNPTQVVYEIATPQTYQLDPVQVACLLGQNNVWCDTGNTTVTYPTNHSYQSLSTTHKYYKRINGVESISVGSDVVADVGTDNIIDLTQMFGTTIADYIYNIEQSSSSNMGVKFFKSLFPNDDYDYNGGELISVNASAHVIKDANGNVLHTYPLDSDLVLRGIPKLDANNKLYYDGDVYQPNGSVTRKYGIVDLGTLSWSYNGTRFMATVSNIVKTVGHDRVKAMTIKYVRFDGAVSSAPDKSLICGGATDPNIYIKDSSYTDETSFKQAMSGVYLVYEVNTPTTESADPFEENQAIVSNGIEEYTVTEQGDVEMPVGHDSTYYATKVYGGTIDMAKGVLTIDRKIVDMGSLSWSLLSNSVFWAMPSGMKPFTHNVLSSQYDEENVGIASLNSGEMTTQAGAGELYVKDTRFTDATSFKNSVNGVQLVYELATPIEISLTPQQMQTLSGQNNIWGNTNGGMYLVYQLPITSLLVKRRDVADISGKWLTLYSTPITQASDMDFTFIDFLNQYGKTYQYALVPVLAQNQSGVIVQIEGGYTVSDNVDSIFDGVYIADQTNVERVKAGVGYGNIDMNQGVGSITPIGSKYPIVITNSQNQYHNGSVRGTIVPNDFYSNGNLSRIDMVNKRDELEQFLTNKRAKIIKDWNGNIWLVMIMSNVACSFDDNYGMGMVSFSADWLEVGDPTNQQDLYNAGLINVGGV